jgi:hypothetical protein
MKNIITYWLLTLSAAFFLACEEVIDIDLNASSPQIVIEAEITNQAGPYIVKITKSANFDDSNNFPPVPNAEVKIDDNMGNQETLTEISPGIYQTNTLQGIEGRTYTLTIQAEGKTYTAESRMPSVVPLDKITLDEVQFGAEKQKVPVPNYRDPYDTENYYRFVQYQNNIRVSTIFVRSDRLSNGNYITQPLIDRDNEFAEGDEIKVEMQCIDQGVYEYFNSLDQLSGNGPNTSASPANPISNIRGGALGYFSAHTLEKKTIMIE